MVCTNHVQMRVTSDWFWCANLDQEGSEADEVSERDEEDLGQEGSRLRSRSSALLVDIHIWLLDAIGQY